MTEKQCLDLVKRISAKYPQANFTQFTAMVWYEDLAEYDYEGMLSALKIYNQTSNSGYAPSVAQLIGCYKKPEDLAQMSESEAWSLVYKALRNSAYNSVAEFEKLPALVQQAVVSPAALKEWATDCSFNEGVAAGQFGRRYQEVIKRNKTISAFDQVAMNRLAEARNEVIAKLESKVQQPLIEAREAKTLTPESFNARSLLMDQLGVSNANNS